jgi:tetratricopeptide (TPR) repeat protein
MAGYKSPPCLLEMLSLLLLSLLVLDCGGETKRLIPPAVTPPVDTQATSPIQPQAQLAQSAPLTIGEQLFSYNQKRKYKHRRCGMCHLDVERGILHRFIEQETDRINPFTGKPFGRVEAICTTCHTSLHLAHPVGIIPDPKKVTLPPEAIGFKGEEDRLTCMSCHDWHPTNTSYKYLRWQVESAEETGRFCLHCHEEKGLVDRKLVKAFKLRQDIKLMSESDPYFKNPQAERSLYFKSHRGAIFNLTTYVQAQIKRAETEETPMVEGGQRGSPLARLAKAGAKREKQTPTGFRANYESARSYKQQGKLNNAIIHFKKAIELKPDFPPIYFELGEVYLANEWPDEAQAMFQQAINLDPNFSPAYVGLGKVYETQGVYSSAAKVYKTALKLDADYGPAYYQLGLLHKRDGRLDEAQAMFEKAIDAHDTDYAAAYYELGLIYKRDNPPKAEEMFAQAIQKADHAGAYYELGLIYKQQGKHSNAGDMFRQAVAAKADNPGAYYELASIYKREGLVDEAISAYTQATKLDRKFAPAYYQLGVIFLENRQLSDAFKMLSQAVKLRPDHHEALYQLAEVYYQQKNFYKAIKLYKQVIAFQDDHVGAYIGLGKCYRQLGKPKEAIANLKRAIAIQPDQAQAHYILATIFKDKGRTAEAEQQFQLALKLSQPESSGPLPSDSLLTDKIALYKIAADLDPENAETFYNLGVAYMAAGQMKEAVAAYRRAIALRPQYEEALYGIALAYKAQNQWPQAVTALQQVIQLKPDFTDARHTLAETLQAQGQWEQAIQQYQRILSQKPVVAYRIGQIYFNQWLTDKNRNNLEQAQRYFSQALEANPQNAAVREMLQQAENLLAGKIQTLLITTSDYARIEAISQLIKRNLSSPELDRLTRHYPHEAKIMFVRPEDLDTPLGEKLAQLKNGTATNIIRHRKQYFIIYRIDSI